MRLAALLLLLLPLQALGGAQEREHLNATMRNRLAAAVGDRPAPRLVFKRSEDGERWLSAMSERLARRIPDRKQRLELLRTIHFEALRAGLDPQLVLGVIEVESGFRKYAVSRAGARGYIAKTSTPVELLSPISKINGSTSINARLPVVVVPSLVAAIGAAGFHPL
jgi:hypothetical protein